jgi:hypothetical protein
MMRALVLIVATLFSVSLLAAGHDLKALPSNPILPVVTGNGSGFTAAWSESVLNAFIVASSLVDAYGNSIENRSTAVDSTRALSLAIAHSPSDALVAWVAWTQFDSDVFAERLSPSGVPMGPIHVAFAKGHTSDVAVSWNGSRYFLVWSNGAQLLGAFIAPDGSSTTPRPLFSEPPFCGGPPEDSVVVPDVAWDGQHFIVVFGEQWATNCYGLEPCPAGSPHQFRVMRISADGVPLDLSPLVIPGHLRAHVASSGAASLIALDSLGGVSAIIAHTEGGLTLDPETPIFLWVSEVSSAVVWDGAMYTVGWRYLGDNRGPSWLGAAKVSRSGLPFDYRFTATGGFTATGDPNSTTDDLIANSFTVSWGRPAIAVNDAGVTALTISELAGPWSFRARLYFASELAPMPKPPPAPRNVVSSFDGSTARIDWQSDGAAAGFAIDAWYAPGNFWWVYRTAPGDARTITFSTVIGSTSIGSLFRVRALGPGGVSEGAITSIGSIRRRRAARP